VISSVQVGENCTVCFPREKYSVVVSSLGAVIRSFSLNNSQEEAVLNCIAARECYHKNIVKLIWGPPGTGKTKTVGSLLFALLKRNCRTLTCAPTNVAVLEVTTRFLRLVMDSFEYNTYGLGDIVLFGNGERMKIDDRDDLLDVFLDYRAHILSECFAPLSGWRHCVQSMICLLEDPEQLYRDYLKIQEKDDEIDDHDYIEVQGEGLLGDGNLKSNKRKEDINAQDLKNPNQSIWRRIITQTLKENKSKKKWKEKVQCHMTHMDNQPKYVKTEKGFPSEDGEIKKLTFLDFVKQKYNFLRKKMVTFIVNMYTHLPTCFISLQVVRKMIKLLGWLECLATMLRSVSVSDLKEALSASGDKGNTVSGYTGNFKLCMTIRECLQILLSLRDTFSLPDFFHEYAIKRFCLRNARMLFCTASSSAKLHEEAIDRLEMLVIDEAAQLKECESIIPLQLPGLHHVVLIGDECQLPAMVKSKVLIQYCSIAFSL
jgi:senataxin